MHPVFNWLRIGRVSKNKIWWWNLECLTVKNCEKSDFQRQNTMLLVYILFSQGLKHFSNLSFCITCPCKQYTDNCLKESTVFTWAYVFPHILSHNFRVGHFGILCKNMYLEHGCGKLLPKTTVYPLSYRVPVRERYGSTLLPATREQHDQNCTQSH